jgi:hypothetical protein
MLNTTERLTLATFCPVFIFLGVIVAVLATGPLPGTLRLELAAIATLSALVGIVAGIVAVTGKG